MLNNTFKERKEHFERVAEMTSMIGLEPIRLMFESIKLWKNLVVVFCCDFQQSRMPIT